MCRRDRLVGAALLAILAAAGSARADDNAVERNRPTGPVNISADRAEWEQGSSMVYTGHVRLDSGDLKMSGDRLELKQFERGAFTAKVTGAPATLDHKGLTESDGKVGPPVSAKAKELDFDSREQIVTVAGDAVLTRGTDVINGENIKYDVAQRRILANAKEGGQVHIILNPQTVKAGVDGKPSSGDKKP